MAAEPHLFSELLHPFLKIIIFLLLFHLLLVDFKTFLHLIQGGALHTHRHPQVSLIWVGSTIKKVTLLQHPQALKKTFPDMDPIKHTAEVITAGRNSLGFVSRRS